MKKVILQLTIALFFTTAATAQAPGIFNYQAVARNLVGNALASKNISVRLTVHDLSPGGTIVYSETRAVTTNAFGLFSLQVGSPGATNVSGTVTGVNWGTGAKYIQVEMDPDGGSSFTTLGTTQLASVPYALNAANAGPVGPAGGDLTGAYPNPALAASGVTAGAYGNAANYPTFTVDSKGRLTLAGTQPLPASLPPNGPAGGDLSGTYPNPTVAVPFVKTSAQAASPLIGMTNSSATGTLGAIQAASASTDANAVAIQGTISSTTPGGFSAAVRGANSGTGGLGIGVYGSQAGSGWGVYGVTPSGVGVFGNSTGNGIGLLGQSSTGNALQTNGKVQMTGISEGAGKVLTSDAAGNATWQTPTAGLSGSGTLNTLPKFTPNGTTLGNSQITDDGTSLGVSTPVLSPNIKMQVTAGAIGNAFRATLTGVPSTSIATAGSIYGESTTGIGVIGVSGSQNGVYGLSTGTLGGTVGVATGTGNGVWGVATGAGVAGYFDGGVTGRGIIVSAGASGMGTSAPTSRLTVMQPATTVPAIDSFPAIFGYSNHLLGCIKGGVFGTYNGTNYGTGVQGVGYNGVNNQDANAIFGVGNQDLGVYGSANTAGVMGGSVGGIGVVGYNKNSSFAATTGIGNTYGVYGNSQTVGGATVPGVRYGVYGFASGAATNYAGYFSGNVQITGSIAKGSGTFKIDDPIDPENKYLYHSFVESPDMMNIYNGNITTDASGNATVTMPDYFNALNKDFRYQLTVIGAFAQAIVGQEMNGNQFVIRTSQPNVKVSWQVTGVRQDKYANAHRVVPEVEKEKEYKGYYLHAKEWGMPEEKSIDYLTRPKTTMPEEKKTVKPVETGTPVREAQGVAGGVKIESIR